MIRPWRAVHSDILDSTVLTDTLCSWVAVERGLGPSLWFAAGVGDRLEGGEFALGEVKTIALALQTCLVFLNEGSEIRSGLGAVSKRVELIFGGLDSVFNQFYDSSLFF